MQHHHIQPAPTAAELLNQQCACVTLDRPLLARNIAHLLGETAEEILSSPVWHQMFSQSAVFAPEADFDQMQAIVRGLETAAALPAYREKVLSWAPLSARFNPGPAGAFMSYDFHLSTDGPRLIEINTNAGGAFLNALLSRAQQECCGGLLNVGWSESFDAAVIAQFESEWRSQRSSERPERIAIVDDLPGGQYLYPEFRLAQQLFRTHGIEALILAPEDLVYRSGVLYAGEHKIDMVYNRLVDFGLDEPEHSTLRAAWLDGGAVITPNPFAHALLADKRNLSVLSDPATLGEWGLGARDAALLAGGIPRTVLVTADNADSLWQNRRALFFKPVAGHGSKGVYRGSKLTRGTFGQILASNYIAQAYVAPSERMVTVDGERQFLKVDVRLYTYRGNLLLAAARLYQGQVTNFRTPGGGFAPLFVLKTGVTNQQAMASCTDC